MASKTKEVNSSEVTQQENEEEVKTDEKKKYYRPSRYTWDRSTVTLETTLIEIPKKSHRIPKPDFDAQDKKIKEIEEQIKYTIERKKKIIEELILKARESKESGNNRAQPLQALFKEKLELKNTLQKEFDEAKKNHNSVKDQITELFNQQQKLRQKMKKAMDAEDIEERLAEINHSLNNDLLNPTEEKKLIKEKEDLEKSLPFAKPINELQAQINELNVQKKAYKETLNKAFTQYDEVRTEVSGLIGNLDEIRNFKNSEKEKNDPIFEEIKKEYDAKIDTLKEQKRKVRDEFRALKEKYDNEQEDIRYHDWVKKIQDDLKRQKQRKEREEQRNAQQEAEERKKIESLENPFQKQIDDCEQIVKYCELLIRAEQKVNQVEQEEEEVKQENTVNEADLKKEKLSIIAPKKELQRFPVNKKKQQPPKKTQNKQQENTKKLISLPLEILNAFESTKVQAPIFQEEVEASLNLAKQKLEYFQQQGEQELAKKKAELLAGISKKNEDSDDNIMDDTDKNNKKSHKVYHERETDFPTL
ncbi:hypothetical protein TTHERM_01276340 (macronuclear) [Tetrahymena thermophila SB210]|uniref:Uncharacterized protein n=1 Tax=Tetrahymena thermophila (strain SB210) TaxID=312017 RepID=Q22A75_TETTS|nr:hypothetical protein TTHERM_01276340 [Tetrahymena thermophila SB210]EAR82182.1 hypothetical protein TTHERM_01276340 [Tetrahymena thermophila SB210]|eukprot:XP_001029845.1 hypothetical protein TTHERM_01276340 [Tetrahymena thermophila SB210]